MKNFLKLLLLMGVVEIGVVSGVIMPKKEIYIAEGEGFVVYLNVSEKFDAIQNCWFQHEGEEKVRLELNTTVAITTEYGALVLPFSDKVCGVRVSEVNVNSTGKWSLEVQNIYGDFEAGSVTIGLVSKSDSNFETVVSREIGTGAIACTKNNELTKRCQIIEDNGKSWDSCELITIMKPNRTFECLMFDWGQIVANHELIKVNIKEPSAASVASVEETDRSYILRCAFDFKASSCLAESPAQKNVFYITEGLYNGKYSTYDTSSSDSVCAFEVPKPLAPNEIGLWRLKNYDLGSTAGCLFYLGREKTEVIDSEIEKIPETRKIEVYSPESDKENLPEIECLLPFVIDDCYLKAPNNSIYFPDSFRFQRQRNFGKCSFMNLPIISGIWSCGARSRQYNKEIIQNIEVEVKSKSGEIASTAIKMKKGRDVELMCRSSFKEPIKNCVFIDPKNRVHLVGTAHSIKTGGHVQYFGSGLHTGDCGVKVFDLNADDFGEWTCQFQVLSNRDVSQFKVLLTETAPSQAYTIGLGVGITTIIVLVGGVILGTIFYKNRQKSAQHTFASPEEEDANGVELPGRINVAT